MKASAHRLVPLGGEVVPLHWGHIWGEGDVGLPKAGKFMGVPPHAGGKAGQIGGAQGGGLPLVGDADGGDVPRGYAGFGCSTQPSWG